jgi:hypothetical protein
MGPEILVPLGFFAFVFAIARMKQQARIAELQMMRGQGVDGNVASEIRQLREQLHELRDTTTRYDMSFDSALQRLESRVSHLETQQRETSAQVNVTQGGTGA